MDSAVWEISPLVCAATFVETKAKLPNAIATPAIARRRVCAPEFAANLVFSFIAALR
jgi:hypothetical protein